MKAAIAAALLLCFPPLPAGGERAGVRGDLIAEIDRTVREGFWDPKLKGVDWEGAVSRARVELARSRTAADRNAVYDRLLATLDDSHTFRVPAGRLPSGRWGTAGLRIGREGNGYAVKGVIPESPADKAGMRIGDRVLSVDGRRYGSERVGFRDLFLVFEGAAGTPVEITWRRDGESAARASRLTRVLEEPGDALVWKSARIVRRDGRSYGYARLWGIGVDTALAVVDLLLDREEPPKARPVLQGWDAIDGFLLDVRGNSGGYDPNILTTFLRGRWSAGDYWVRTREGRRLVPPEYRPLPVALLVNSGTASAGEALALKFQAHRIGPVVGEVTAGMASGGAHSHRLSDGSLLWMSAAKIEDAAGRSYEGEGVPPDVVVADRPGPAGGEDAIVEAAIRALEKRGQIYLFNPAISGK
jgi:carboxyl-terminal processing protease